MAITIYSASTKSLIQGKQLQALLEPLPASLHSKALRYKSELSAYNYVVGRLLLKHGLEKYGLDHDLNQIEFEKNGKPYLPEIHFNISHSDHRVICAFSKEGPIGVDLEKINPIDFGNFTAMFSAQEWDAIKGATDPLKTFYWFWTRKESIIKVLGRNLDYLHEIELDVSLDYYTVKGKRYFLNDVIVDREYIGAISSDKEIVEMELQEIKF